LLSDRDRQGRVLALDVGETRTGVAVSSADRRHASPLSVLDTKGLLAIGKELSGLIADYEIDTLVIGLPLLADGSEGQQARRTRSLSSKMLEAITGCTDMDALRQGLEVVYFDERQSSSEAKRAGHSMGMSERDMRGKLDGQAAAVILARYLDTMNG